MGNEIIDCICTICGIRNDHLHEQGLCKNGHDSWLEYRDVLAAGLLSPNSIKFSSAPEIAPFKKALRATGLSPNKLRLAFLDNSIKQIEIIKPTQL